jgi:anti-anti-sigma factor
MSLEVRISGEIAILVPRSLFLGGEETDELQNKIKERWETGDHRVIPKSLILGEEEANELEDKIGELLEAGNCRLIVNLSQVQVMDDAAYGVLIAAHNNYARRGGKMKLCTVDRKIQNTFELLNLSSKFEVYNSEDEALKGFN